jgi:hypothetical protein
LFFTEGSLIGPQISVANWTPMSLGGAIGYNCLRVFCFGV